MTLEYIQGDVEQESIKAVFAALLEGCHKVGLTLKHNTAFKNKTVA